MEAGWRSGSSRSSNMRSLRSDGDSTVDARPKTQPIDNYLSWVMYRLIVWTHKYCGPHTTIYYPSDRLHERSTTERSTTERSTTERSTTERSATRVSAVDQMMQVVNYIDRRYAAVDLASI